MLKALQSGANQESFYCQLGSESKLQNSAEVSINMDVICICSNLCLNDALMVVGSY